MHRSRGLLWVAVFKYAVGHADTPSLEEQAMGSLEAQAKEAATDGMRVWGAIVGWIDQPIRTMRFVMSHPRTWFVPAILILASMVALTIISAPLAAERTNQEVEAQLSRMSIPEEQRELVSRYALDMTPQRMILTGVGGGIIVLGLGWVFSATVFHFSALVFGGESRFRGMFTMVVWSGLPYAVRNIVQAAYVAWTGEIIASPGLGALVGSGDPVTDSQSIWYVVLSSIDLFLLWHLLLSSLGISVASGFSRAKSGILRMVWWAVFTAVRVVPAMIGGALVGRLMGG